jgi:hypothetical protein
MLDWLTTRDIMMRRHWHIDSGPECTLCSSAILEKRDHLFFHCEFAVDCWNSINIQWDVALPLSDRFVVEQAALQGPCFMEIVAC